MALAEVRRGPGLKNRNISDNAGIQKHKLDPSYRFMYDDFKATPYAQLVGGGAATGGTGDVSVFFTDNGNKYYNQALGAGQTLITPVIAATGLDVAGDQTNTEGRIIHFGCGTNNANDRMAFTIGTDSFFIKLKFSIVDVSGTDDCAVGFHKQETETVLDDYSDFAVLNVISGAIKTEYAVNDAATTTSSSLATWADTATKTLEIRVDARGNTSAFVDGTSVSANFMKFDSGDVVVPFFYVLQAGDLSGAIVFQELSCGMQDANVR